MDCITTGKPGTLHQTLAASRNVCYTLPSPTQTSHCDHLDTTVGYPLSHFVRSLPYHNLSYAAREVACHSIEAYKERLLGIYMYIYSLNKLLLLTVKFGYHSCSQ